MFMLPYMVCQVINGPNPNFLFFPVHIAGIHDYIVVLALFVYNFHVMIEQGSSGIMGVVQCGEVGIV